MAQVPKRNYRAWDSDNNLVYDVLYCTRIFEKVTPLQKVPKQV